MYILNTGSVNKLKIVSNIFGPLDLMFQFNSTINNFSCIQLFEHYICATLSVTVTMKSKQSKFFINIDGNFGSMLVLLSSILFTTCKEVAPNKNIDEFTNGISSFSMEFYQVYSN